MIRPFGPSLVVLTVVLALTGVGLLVHYVPSTALAFDSLVALQQDIGLGRLARSLHHHGTSFLVALIGLQLGWLLLQGGYRGPGRRLWWGLLGLLVVAIAFDVTGQLLPWNEHGLQATEIRLGLVLDTPAIGPWLGDLVLGGDRIAGPTLTRFFALHVVVLPAVLLILGRLLVSWARAAAPTRARAGALLSVAIAAGLLVLALERPAPLGAVHAPGDTGYQARPEWYMHWLNQLLKIFTGPAATFAALAVPGLILGWAAAVPILDRDGRRHRLAVAGSAAILLALAGLSLPNLMNPVDNRPALPAPLGLTPVERQGYLLVRGQKCLECHHYTRETPEGTVIDHFTGDPEDERLEDAPPIEDMLIDDLEGFAFLLEDPEETIGSEVMPAFDHLTHEQRRAIGRFLRRLTED